MDTPCADPELQLDVDLMVLEYTLFQAIEAHLSVLSRGGFQDEEAARGLQRELAMFESFLEVFNHNHPLYEQSPEFTLRLQFLEFLVLLLSLSCGRCHRSSAAAISADCCCCCRCCLSSTVDASVMLLDRRSAMDDLRTRRRWLARRERGYQQGGKGSVTAAGELDLDHAQAAWGLEQRIYSAWSPRGAHHACPAPLHTTGPPSLLLSLSLLLPRFMAMSARFVDVTKQGPSDLWIDVACEFMLQAGLESLRVRRDDGGSECLPSLEDCFAWGYNGDVPSHSFLEDNDGDDDEKQTEIVLNNLFRLRRHETGADVDMEDPEWTELRLDTVQEFTIPVPLPVRRRRFSSSLSLRVRVPTPPPPPRAPDRQIPRGEFPAPPRPPAPGHVGPGVPRRRAGEAGAGGDRGGTRAESRRNGRRGGVGV
ncbi:hypothetical protein AYL99_07738 [Fonsecaea erecta]|uniref:Uncharacterized protein n=1 Tax=Fonsecaea erecta TaxID=1367422 RepID=A0A178ZFV5_9EURO|nr:hypothetical protein AYL99_07738 [Fonsecaea erecta]OAP58648.1 hypothetical protein AYL99_07738 [Fonsecaea erecta]